VRYDIFGTDVLIANKMESNGEKGRINISEDTKRLLESDEKGKKYNYIPNKTVTIKKNNTTKHVNCYFLDDKEE